MSSTSGDEQAARPPVDQDEPTRLVEQRDEPLTATDWFFSHAVRMRAAYRPQQRDRPTEASGGEDPAPGAGNGV